MLWYSSIYVNKYKYIYRLQIVLIHLQLISIPPCHTNNPKDSHINNFWYMERPIFSLLLTTYHGVFDSYLVFPWRPIMFINDDQWSRLMGRLDLFLFISYLYSWQEQRRKTTHFHQQKLKKYNQQGYKIPHA